MMQPEYLNELKRGISDFYRETYELVTRIYKFSKLETINPEYIVDIVFNPETENIVTVTLFNEEDETNEDAFYFNIPFAYYSNDDIWKAVFSEAANKVNKALESMNKVKEEVNDK